MEIPLQVQEEVTPTRECLSLAEELVFGYAQRYPAEAWPLIRCEEPVQFPLLEPDHYRACGKCGYFEDFLKVRPSSCCPRCGGICTVGNNGVDELIGLAKIDSYFYVPEPTIVESGIAGITYTLSQGWWIHEYKTKSPFISMPLYMQGWEMNLQASYQLTALAHKIGEPIQGVLVNVLEKPRRHIPQRKCRPCNENFEFATWVPTGTGLYQCPACGSAQKLTPLKEAPVQIPPAFYRIAVTRSQRELDAAKREMIQVGQRMIAMEAGGRHSEPWKHGSCVNYQWRRACEFFSACKDDLDTKADNLTYQDAPEYRGLVQID